MRAQPRARHDSAPGANRCGARTDSIGARLDERHGRLLFQRHGTIAITAVSRVDRTLCRRATRSVVRGKGGATPAGRPAPRSAGSRLREIGGVAPPLPVTRRSPPDAANHAALPSCSARHNVPVFHGRCGGASGACLSSRPRNSGPMEGPAPGPPASETAGPINTPPATIRTGCRSRAILASTIGRQAPSGRAIRCFGNRGRARP